MIRMMMLKGYGSWFPARDAMGRTVRSRAGEGWMDCGGTMGREREMVEGGIGWCRCRCRWFGLSRKNVTYFSWLEKSSVVSSSSQDSSHRCLASLLPLAASVSSASQSV